MPESDDDGIYDDSDEATQNDTVDKDACCDTTDSEEADAFDSIDEAFDSGMEHAKAGQKEDAVLCFGFAVQLAEQNYGPAKAECARCDDTKSARSMARTLNAQADVRRYYYHYGDALLTADDKSAEDLLDTAAASLGRQADDDDDEADLAALEAAGATSPGGRERPQDDIELAWEMLELARVCAEKLPTIKDGSSVLLADVHSRLGDLHQANEQFDQAVAEYRRAVDIRSGGRRPGFEADVRRLAAEHCNLGRAFFWSTPPAQDAAAAEYRHALSLLDEILEQLTDAPGAVELAEARAEVATKLAELGVHVDHKQGTAASSKRASEMEHSNTTKRLKVPSTDLCAAPPQTHRGSVGTEQLFEHATFRVWRRLLQPQINASTSNNDFTTYFEHTGSWVCIMLDISTNSIAEVANWRFAAAAKSPTWVARQSTDPWTGDGDEGWMAVRLMPTSDDQPAGALHQIVVERVGQQAQTNLMADLNQAQDGPAGTSVLHDGWWCRISEIELAPGAEFDGNYRWPCLLINPAMDPSSPVAYEFIIGEAGDDAGGHVAEFAPGGTLFLDYGVGKMRTCNRTVVNDAAAVGTSRLLALELKF